jgi:hypothetical protein
VVIDRETGQAANEFRFKLSHNVESDLQMPPTDSDGEVQDEAAGEMAEISGRRIGSTSRWPGRELAG